MIPRCPSHGPLHRVEVLEHGGEAWACPASACPEVANLGGLDEWERLALDHPRPVPRRPRTVDEQFAAGWRGTA